MRRDNVSFIICSTLVLREMWNWFYVHVFYPITAFFVDDKQTFFYYEFTNYILNDIRFAHTFNTKTFGNKKQLDALHLYAIFETRPSQTLPLNIITFIKRNNNALCSIVVILYRRDKNPLFTKEMHPGREPTRNIQHPSYFLLYFFILLSSRKNWDIRIVFVHIHVNCTACEFI